MKRFISTEFFRLLQEASKQSIDKDAQVFENEYERFVMLLFSEGAASTDRAAYYNTLVYTRAELAGLTESPTFQSDLHIIPKSKRLGDYCFRGDHNRSFLFPENIPTERKTRTSDSNRPCL
jgi:hypothetical protein